MGGLSAIYIRKQHPAHVIPADRVARYFSITHSDSNQDWQSYRIGFANESVIGPAVSELSKDSEAIFLSYHSSMEYIDYRRFCRGECRRALYHGDGEWEAVEGEREDWEAGFFPVAPIVGEFEPMITAYDMCETIAGFHGLPDWANGSNLAEWPVASGPKESLPRQPWWRFWK